ncbi:hypothetical protein G5C51_04715 [Streptomyces sp. A7024]|uniref:Putative Flp pilus-assembly TadG-like N-terminal domain-containing protein n=1 Tax=Streptomyces coryli TaxID=1128680 RepID=A0A6G4TW32_9ACTN|nr:pilus assembly protein TadG-related protein [Streptomyces coryli]NGN63211.1 hypothetical protein [Streptomyces coryli]
MKQITGWLRYLHRRNERWGDRGSLSPFFAASCIAILMIAGLVVDGGGRLRAGSQANMVAQEAARTAGQQIDAGKAVPGTAIVVDPAAASAAARRYLNEAGMTGDVTVSDDGKTLTVKVQDTYQTKFVTLIGYSSMAVTGEATATLYTTAGG